MFIIATKIQRNRVFSAILGLYNSIFLPLPPTMVAGLTQNQQFQYTLWSLHFRNRSVCVALTRCSSWKCLYFSMAQGLLKNSYVFNQGGSMKMASWKNIMCSSENYSLKMACVQRTAHRPPGKTVCVRGIKAEMSRLSISVLVES